MDKVDFDSPSVTSYLTVLQTVITRMATNSASSKTWCITLVSAMIVIVADKGKPAYIGIPSIPILLFFLLDSYYLSLERQFRSVYNEFIKKVQFGNATVDDVFLIAPRESVLHSTKSIAAAACSIATWPFYVLLATMLLVVRTWIL